MDQLKIEHVTLDRLKPWAKNPRKNDEASVKLARLIETHGFINPIIASPDGTIRAGHTRFKAAKIAKLEKVPVVFVDFESEAKASAYALADNKSQEYSEWDFSEIANVLTEIEAGGIPLDATGFNDDELERMRKSDVIGLTDPDDIPEIDESKVKSKLGDIYELGNHRLMCGDATDFVSVKNLMGKSKSDMVFTSPPYNCGIKYNEYDDAKSKADYLKFINSVISNCFMIMNDGRSIFWNCGASPKSHAHAHALEINGFVLLRQIIWKKTGAPIPLWRNTKKKPVARNYLPNYTHENIFYASKGKISHGEPTEHSDILCNDVWEISQFSAGGNNHPAAFPLKLVELPIVSMTNEYENLFEPFGGSGSTLIACEKTNRTCFMMEIDPYYVDIIVTRWCKFTGVTKIKRNNEPVEWDVHGQTRI